MWERFIKLWVIYRFLQQASFTSASGFPAPSPSPVHLHFYLFIFLNLLSVLSTSCFLWQGQCCHGNPGHYRSIMASYHTAQLTIYLQLLSQWCCMFIEKHSKRSANLHKSNIFKLRISDMTKAYYIMILIRFDIR